MNYFVMVIGLSLFFAISLAVKFHFASNHVPRGMILVSVLSFAAAISFAFIVSTEYPVVIANIFSLIIFAISGFLFIITITETRSLRLKLAFDIDNPTIIANKGPYKYIRHPFYTSYILFWMGCAIATLHPINFAFLLVITAIYTIAAIREERAFDASSLANDYAQYRRTAGLFWPKFRSTGNV